MQAPGTPDGGVSRGHSLSAKGTRVDPYDTEGLLKFAQFGGTGGSVGSQTPNEAKTTLYVIFILKPIHGILKKVHPEHRFSQVAESVKI